MASDIMMIATIPTCGEESFQICDISDTLLTNQCAVDANSFS